MLRTTRALLRRGLADMSDALCSEYIAARCDLLVWSIAYKVLLVV